MLWLMAWAQGPIASTKSADGLYPIKTFYQGSSVAAWLFNFGEARAHFLRSYTACMVLKKAIGKELN